MSIKKQFIQTAIIGFFYASAFSTQAQIFVSPASGSSPGNSPGFYYALPENTLRLEVIIQKTQQYRGPYAEFAEKILGVSEYIQADETKLEIKDMLVKLESTPDPDAWFLAELDDKASKESISQVFSLLPDGIILAADDAALARQTATQKIEKTLVNAPDEQYFSYYAESNLYKRVDTIVRKITIDTTVIKRNILQSAWVDRSPEQKARAAADMIQKIRESRLLLLTGYQEVNYGSSLGFMDEKLNELEEAYLSLFLGKTVRTLTTEVLYFTPKAGQSGKINIAGFSETAGLVSETAKANPITIDLQVVGGPGFNESAKPGARLNNAMYYRIPALTSVSIAYGSKTFIKDRMYISQLGSVAVAPLGKVRLQFDPETGMITTIKKE